MNGKLMLYLDQFGNYFYARTVRELRGRLEAAGAESQKCMLETGPTVSPDISVMSSRGIG